MTFDPRPFIDGLRAANERESRETTKRAILARKEARRLARAIMARDADVVEVYLFGSLAEGEPSRPDFDIDLALVGGDTYRAMDVTEESEFSVDVVRLDLLAAHVQERIRSAGVVLSRRGKTNSTRS